MFLKEEFTYVIIDATVSIDDLKNWCKENNVSIKPNSNAEIWAMFTQYYARTHGLDVVSATSMAYIISALYGGFGVSASTEMYIREEEITFQSIEHLNDLRTRFDSERDVAINLFRFVFDLYKYHIVDYEYKDHSICFRLGESSMVRFMNVDGETKTDKFLKLIQYWDEHHS